MNAQVVRPSAPSAPRVLRADGLAAAVDALLDELARLQQQLVALDELAAAKLAAIRRADGRGLEQLALDEADLLREVLVAGTQRGALLAQVAQRLPGGGGELTLRRIADELAEPRRSRLRARSAALSERSRELQRKNRLVADVARNLQGHIRGVFADLASAAQETHVYGSGRSGPRAVCRSWIDAVG